MCPPTYLDASIANNERMHKLTEDERIVDMDKATKQFMDLYSLCTQQSLVYLIPPVKGLGDQVYISNAACVLPHLDKTSILANFSVDNRIGEELSVKALLHDLDFEIYDCPYHFEGEADLKWLRDDMYLGGYGQRGELKALEWIEKQFDCTIIKIKENDPYLYHLDCSVFPLDINNVMVFEDIINKKTMDEIKEAAEVIPVGKTDAYEGITNNLRIGSILFNGVCSENTPEIQQKNDRLIEICENFGLRPVFIDISEYLKSGASLSCMIMHLSQDEVKF